MRASSMHWGTAATAIVLMAAGCGPVQYIGTVTQTASSEVAAAKAANADKYAPYEYTCATEYIHKAREEEGYADHQSAVRFGKLAADRAKKAKQIAVENAGKPPEANPAESPPPEGGDNENPLDMVTPQRPK